MANEQSIEEGQQQQQAQNGQQQNGQEAAPNATENTNGVAEAANGEQVRKFNEEQMQRKVLCRTCDGDIVEAPWHLMTQSRTFINMWESLGMEEKFCKSDTEPFVFPLNEIAGECFGHILQWMEKHHGLPEPIVREDPVTLERIWFKFTDWEKQFFDTDFETVKEYFLAANFLDLRSLYLYCAQECARCIMDKTPDEIRDMLCLEDDLTAEDKERIKAEFEIPELPTNECEVHPAHNLTNGTGGEAKGQASSSSNQQGNNGGNSNSS